MKELGIEQDVDTLARWMAHYLAEKIHQVEVLPKSNEKTEAEKECCELILKIWDHRSQMPRGRRPFESFEPILTVLKSLDPDNNEPFLHRMSTHELSQLEKTNPNYKDIKNYIDTVIEIDKVARVWIENLLNQAALKVSDERTKAWLQTASQVSFPDDIHSMQVLYKKFNLLDDDYDTLPKDTDRLEMRIQQLESFTKLNEMLLTMYQNELSNKRKLRPK